MRVQGYTTTNSTQEEQGGDRDRHDKSGDRRYTGGDRDRHDISGDRRYTGGDRDRDELEMQIK